MAEGGAFVESDQARGKVAVPVSVESRFAVLRAWLFLGIGLALPFAAFPLFRVRGRWVDLSTVLALLFVASSFPLALRSWRRLPWRWLLAAFTVPLLALLSPIVPLFSRLQFGFSYVHWMLMGMVFLSAWVLPLSYRLLCRFLALLTLVVALVALFALYQVAGIPRGWPLTGNVISSLQSEPFRLFVQQPLVRPTSFFLEPAWLGGYLAWASAVLLAALLSPRIPGALRAWASLAFILSVAAGASTISWGGYVDGVLAVGGVGFAALASGSPILRKRLATIAAFIVAFLALSALSPMGRGVTRSIEARVLRLRQTPLAGKVPEGVVIDSTRERADNLRDIVSHFRLRPLSGIGLGQFEAFQTKLLERPAGYTQPWSGWPGIAAETGILGPVVLAGALLLLFRIEVRSRPLFVRLLFPGLLPFLVFQQVHRAAYISLAWWFPLALLVVFLSMEDPDESPSGA